MDKQAMLTQIDAQLQRARDGVLRLEGYRMGILDIIKAEAAETAKADAEAANSSQESGNAEAAA